MLIFNHEKKIQLSKKGYFNTRNEAWKFLIENNVTSYPLDLKQIIKQNDWKVLDLRKYVLEHLELRKYVKKNEGLTIEKDGKYIILINPANSTLERNRFTIAHEIGHIYLQHIGTNNKLIEKEANMFASRILMPMFLIKELNITSAEELSRICQVSIEAATWRMKRYNEIKDRQKFYTNPLEVKVRDQLSEFIQRSKQDK